MMPISVLVVDDSAFMRKVISEMIASDPELSVRGHGQGRQGCHRESQIA